MIDSTKNCFEYETYHEGESKILKVYLEKCNFPPSIEYSQTCMSKVIDALLSNSGITTIMLSQLRQYEYDYSQTILLVELTALYKKLNKDQRYSYSHLLVNPIHERYISGSFAILQRLINKSLKEDPLAAYMELKRLERHEKIKLENIKDERHAQSQHQLIQIMQEIISSVEQLQLIKLLLPHLQDYQLGNRQLYAYVLHPTTKPDFMYTKLVTDFPEGELIESYNFTMQEDTCQVNMFAFDDNVKILYHLTPPEFQFKEELYELLDDAKRIMSEHKPTKEEFVDP